MGRKRVSLASVEAPDTPAHDVMDGEKVQEKIEDVSTAVEQIKNDAVRKLLIGIVEPLLSIPLEGRHEWADECVDWIGRSLKEVEAEKGEKVKDLHGQLEEKKRHIKDQELNNSKLASDIISVQHTVVRRTITKEKFDADLDGAKEKQAEKDAVLADKTKALDAAKKTSDLCAAWVEEFAEYREQAAKGADADDSKKMKKTALSFWTKKFKSSLEGSLVMGLDSVFSKEPDSASWSAFGKMAIGNLADKLAKDKTEAAEEVVKLEKVVKAAALPDETEAYVEYCGIHVEAVSKKLELAEKELEKLRDEKTDCIANIEDLKEDLQALKSELADAEKHFDEIYGAMGSFRFLQSRTNVGVCPPTAWTPYRRASVYGSDQKRLKTPFGRRPQGNEMYGLTPHKSPAVGAGSIGDASPYPAFHFKKQEVPEASEEVEPFVPPVPPKLEDVAEEEEAVMHDEEQNEEEMPPAEGAQGEGVPDVEMPLQADVADAEQVQPAEQVNDVGFVPPAPPQGEIAWGQQQNDIYSQQQWAEQQQQQALYYQQQQQMAMQQQYTQGQYGGQQGAYGGQQGQYGGQQGYGYY